MIKHIIACDKSSTDFVISQGCVQSIYEIKNGIFEYIYNYFILRKEIYDFEKIEKELDKLVIECDVSYTYPVFDDQLTKDYNSVSLTKDYRIWSLVRKLKTLNTNTNFSEERVFLLILKEDDEHFYKSNEFIKLNERFKPEVVSFIQGQINPQ